MTDGEHEPERRTCPHCDAEFEFLLPRASGDVRVLESSGEPDEAGDGRRTMQALCPEGHALTVTYRWPVEET